MVSLFNILDSFVYAFLSLLSLYSNFCFFSFAHVDDKSAKSVRLVVVGGGGLVSYAREGGELRRRQQKPMGGLNDEAS